MLVVKPSMLWHTMRAWPGSSFKVAASGDVTGHFPHLHLWATVFFDLGIHFARPAPPDLDISRTGLNRSELSRGNLPQSFAFDWKTCSRDCWSAVWNSSRSNRLLLTAILQSFSLYITGWIIGSYS